GAKPFGSGGLICQDEKTSDAQEHRRNTFEDQQPLPALQTRNTAQLEQRSRNGRPDNIRDRNSEQKRGRCLSTPRSRKPCREVKINPWRKPSLPDSEQESRKREALRPDDERCGHRDQSPSNHDSRDPESCSDALHDQIAGNFKQKETEETEAGADTT